MTKYAPLQGARIGDFELGKHALASDDLCGRCGEPTMDKVEATGKPICDVCWSHLDAKAASHGRGRDASR